MKMIHDQLNDLKITDTQAQLLEQLFEQTIALLEAFKNPGHDFFDLQKKAILKSLTNALTGYQQGYWGKTDRVEKINGFMVARGQLHYLLSQALATCQARGNSGMRRSFLSILNF
jgi:hypothetical protein